MNNQIYTSSLFDLFVLFVIKQINMCHESRYFRWIYILSILRNYQMWCYVFPKWKYTWYSIWIRVKIQLMFNLFNNCNICSGKKSTNAEEKGICYKLPFFEKYFFMKMINILDNFYQFIHVSMHDACQWASKPITPLT